MSDISQQLQQIAEAVAALQVALDVAESQVVELTHRNRNLEMAEIKAADKYERLLGEYQRLRDSYKSLRSEQKPEKEEKHFLSQSPTRIGSPNLEIPQNTVSNPSTSNQASRRYQYPNLSQDALLQFFREAQFAVTTKYGGKVYKVSQHGPDNNRTFIWRCDKGCNDKLLGSHQLKALAYDIAMHVQTDHTHYI